MEHSHVSSLDNSKDVLGPGQGHKPEDMMIQVISCVEEERISGKEYGAVEMLKRWKSLVVELLSIYMAPRLAPRAGELPLPRLLIPIVHHELIRGFT